ncbi:PREDICTED: reverse mRNAase [Prunus dulcis]|uniref:PREDICTED: reverse mRNAase n=1 Tax=Prunus dulcis TaxID=3755 RepID=A0A5E4GHC3_PRUDU|nr:PREDICTED: reverse mRNAase [Prunus dulcis]
MGPSREMTILCWNVRSLGNPRTFSALRYLLRHKKTGVIFLSETKKTIQQMAGVSAQLGAMGHFSVSRNSHADGLALLWQHGVKVSIRSISSGHIDVMIEGVAQTCFHFTGFYGNPELASRKYSWE